MKFYNKRDESDIAYALMENIIRVHKMIEQIAIGSSEEKEH
jgi:hypothetical protein